MLRGGIIAVLLALGMSATAQQYDVNGDSLTPLPRIGVDMPGALLTSFTTPQRVIGIAPDGDNLWAVYISSPSVIYEFDKAGNQLSTVQSQFANPYGMGFDSMRGQFVLASASSAQIARVNPSGAVTTLFPSPSTRPIGVAYDQNRDAYWVPDWNANLLHLLKASDGTTLQPSFSLTPSGCTRAADIGYSPMNDLLAIVGRDGNQTYLFSAGNPPTFLRAVPFSVNPSGNPRGAAIPDRSQTLWTTAFSANQALEYDLGLPRVQAQSSVRVGRALALNFIATNSPNKVYQAAASFTEGVAGIQFGMRYFPLALDNLFGLSVTVPQIFSGMRGTLNPSGLAAGAVNVPNVGALAGLSFSVAFVTADAAAPQGIFDISGPRRIKIDP